MKIETIIEPNEHIFAIQRRYVDIVSRTLPGRHIEMVGGMAVPMIGRPELDILVITDDVEGDATKLEVVGFGYRTPADDAVYLKQKVEGVEVTVQVMREDNKLVKILRQVLALLQADESLRKEYEEFKKTLAGLERPEYKKRKVEYLQKNIFPKIQE